MSILNITVSPAWGVISADTCAWEPADGKAAAPGEPLPFQTTSKITALPHMGAAVAGNGVLMLAQSVANLLASLPCEDTAFLPEIAPPRLCPVERYIREQLPQIPQQAFGYVGVVAGWSESRQRVIGWEVRSGDGFIFRPVTEPATQPAIDGDDPDIQALKTLLESAEESTEKTRAFHAALARNQFRAYRAGKYPAGYHCGGQLHIATVSKAGITITREVTFNN